MRSSGIMPDIESRHRQGRVRGLRAASRLVAVALLVAPVMAGCGNGGFRPLYGSAALGGAAASERLAEVAIGPIPGRVGQQVRNELIFHATGGGGQSRGDKDQRDRGRVGAEHRTAVKAEPTEPEQKDADGRQRHAVAEDGPDFAIDIFALARA